MASSWLDSWGASWGDSWGQQVADPNALRGTAAGGSTAGATLTAIAWVAGSAAGSSTAQAYLELDGGPVETPASGGGTAHPRRPWVVPAQFAKVPSRRRDEEALLLLGTL